MRRLIVLLVAVVGLSFAATGIAAAAPPPLFNQVCSGTGADATVCQESKKGQNANNNSFYGSNGILMRVANVMAAVVGVAAIIIIIIAGINFIMAQGDANKIQTARNTVMYAAIGLVVVLLARTIIAFVISKAV